MAKRESIGSLSGLFYTTEERNYFYPEKKLRAWVWPAVMVLLTVGALAAAFCFLPVTREVAGEEFSERATVLHRAYVPATTVQAGQETTVLGERFIVVLQVSNRGVVTIDGNNDEARHDWATYKEGQAVMVRLRPHYKEERVHGDVQARTPTRVEVVHISELDAR